MDFKRERRAAREINKAMRSFRDISFSQSGRVNYSQKWEK